MNDRAQGALIAARYGWVSLLAATVTIVVFEVLTWFFVMFIYGLLVIVLPALLVVAAVGAACVACGGVTAQVGRGMLVGSMAAPLSMLLFGGAFILAVTTGLIN